MTDIRAARLRLAAGVARAALCAAILAGASLAPAGRVRAAPIHTAGEDDQPVPAAQTAAAGAATGILDFRITGDAGQPVPGRLTFVTDDDINPDLFPNADARPDDLAVRRNVVYTLSGAGRITVPAGEYTVYASRGLEWSIASAPITIREGRTTTFTARLRHEVDTTGWISGDFHLHTLTYSGHGDSNMKERIISIVGEGVEFAVATDHNHHTDYGPTIEHLHAGDEMTAVTGNEVSVPIGHFNAFPLDPDDAPVDAGIDDANTLFRLLRGQRSTFGIVPVIQVNHPRWDGIDYFAVGGLDPVTGVEASDRYSDDFDTIEVLNENTGWGYYQAFVDGVPTDGNVHSVVRDWFNLLNRGHRYAAVGNSDSHTVHYAFAGYPRNFVSCSTDTPAAIDPAEIAATLRERRVFTTTGPFVELRVGGASMGGRVAAERRAVEVFIRVQAASWIDCDRVHLVVNGDVVETIPVPDSRDVVRLETTRSVHLERDAWIALLVEGDDPMTPILVGGGRPIRPLAVVNPVWVDAEGDDEWVSPWEQALAAVDAAASTDALAAAARGPSRIGLLILAAVERDRPFAMRLVRDGLAHADRLVRLSAARGAEQLGDASLRPDLAAAARTADGDPYLRVALLRAVAACGTDSLAAPLVALLAGDAPPLPSRYLEELIPALSGGFVDDWLAIGYFPAPAEGVVTSATIPPELDPDPARVHAGRQANPAGWLAATTTAAGYLDLRDLAGDPAHAENAIAVAQTWLHCPDDREVPITLGTDDGSRVYLNGEVVYENPSRRAAKPFEHVATWPLRRGWNRVVFKVENGSGGFGIYFRVLDDDVTWSARPARP